MEKKLYLSKVLDNINLTKDTIHLFLEKPKDFEFTAGQFVQLEAPDKEDKNEKIFRPYSLASIPEDKHLEFFIRVVPDGTVSVFLSKAQKGDEINIQEANGAFVSEDIDCSMYFIATGVGIAPIIGMIRDQLENKDNKNPIKLLFGLRFEEDMFLIEKLDEMTKKYPNFEYKLTLSKPSEKWKGLKGRVTEHISENLEKNCHFYICGNLNMVEDAKKILEEKGFEKEQIHFEMF
jgi:ferredoxin-NADP reductase